MSKVAKSKFEEITPDRVEVLIDRFATEIADLIGADEDELMDVVIGFDLALRKAAGVVDEAPTRPQCPPARRARRDVETAVYRAFDAQGRLLYVGITSHARTRMRAHEKTSEWWDEMQSVAFEWMPDRSAAEQRERDLIVSLRPPFNTSMNPEAS